MYFLKERSSIKREITKGKRATRYARFLDWVGKALGIIIIDKGRIIIKNVTSQRDKFGSPLPGS